METWKKFFLIFGSLLTVSGLTAQPNFRHLTIEDGLSQSSVKCIYQDSKGFLWFGTADGLNKYDGYQFTVFRNNPIDPTSISGNDISCIYENPKDSTLWIGTQDGGLNVFDRKLTSFSSFKMGSRAGNSSFSNNIRDLLITPDGKVMIASYQGGLFYFSPTDSDFIKPEFNNDQELRNINCIEKDNEGNIWIGATTGLFKWSFNGQILKGDPQKIDLGLLGQTINVRALKTDFKGNIWVGTQNNGLIRFHPATKNIIIYNTAAEDNPLPSNSIRSILQSERGDIWIGTMNGLCKFKMDTGNFEVIQNQRNNPESINNNIIYSLFEDHSGIIWIGTYLGGINKFDPLVSRFPILRNFNPDKNNQYANNNIRSICKDKQNNLWIGTSNGLVKLKNQNNYIEINPTDIEIYFEGSESHSLLFHNDLGLFVSNANGFFRYDKNNSFVDVSSQIKDDTGLNMRFFTDGLVDYNKNLWFVGSTVLLNYDSNLEKFRYFSPKGPEGVEMQIYGVSLLEDYSGKIWIGTLDGKLYMFDKHVKEFEQIIPGTNVNELVSFNKIFSLCENSPDNLWIGTNRGLYHLHTKSKELVRFLDVDGLANNVVYAVLNDSEERIWCSTNKGISCYNQKTKKFQNFSYEYGLQSNEFNQGAYYKDEEGKIYFGGIKGLNVFKPEEISMNPFIPTVVLTGMEIQYRTVTPELNPDILPNHINETKQIKLNHKQNTFSFEFTALSFSLPEKNQYQFTLTKSGEIDNWILNGTRRFATYTNVPPGNYEFKVKGSNSDGVWNENPTTLKIIINPPYWQTWWFRVSMLLFLILSIYLVFYIRLNSIKYQKKLLEARVQAKTERLSKQKEQIEKQNRELKEINEKISGHNEKIIQKNNILNLQHRQILKQRDELIQMADNVREANQAKLRFFTSISHELRTPLTLIMVPLKELIAQKKPMNEGEIKRRFGVIYANASKLLLMVNQLLDFRKTDLGKMKLLVSDFNLTSFLHETAFLFNDLAVRGNYRFVFVASKEKIEVWADREKLEKVVYNLLSNAFKYTPEGGEIEIQLSTEIQKNTDTEAIITIRDNGEGIEAENLPFIFERFYQPNTINKDSYQGSGLGLAISKKYIELHDGSITVSSKRGAGSTFTIRIPLSKDHFNEHVIFTESQQTQKELLSSSIGEFSPVIFNKIIDSKDRDKPVVLVIEDDESLRNYLKEILKEQYQVLVAQNAREGQKLAETKHPEIILCDGVLPDSSGIEFCKLIKKEFSTSHIPLILLTSLTDNESYMKGLKAGADSYITKPFELEHLYLNIENLIEGRRRLRKKFNVGESVKFDEIINGFSDQQFLSKAVSCVENNLDKSDFNVERFCMLMDLSQPQVYRKIKALTNLNISEFIRNIRLKKAASLLKTGNYKINEVAYETGFNDPNYFTKSFIKLFGMSPREYTNSL